MPNQITAFAYLSVQNGNLKRSPLPVTIQADQTSAKADHPVLDIGTTEEVLSFGDVTTPRWAQFTNLDATNYVDIGPESGGVMVPLGQILPGEFAILPLYPGVTLRARANGGTVRLDCFVLDT